MNELRRDLAPSERRSSGSANRRLSNIVFGGILLLVGISIGFSISEWSTGPVSFNEAVASIDQDRSTDRSGDDIDFQLFWTVWDRITEQHITQPVDEQELLYGALRGLVAGLDDPYSLFLPPSESDDFLSEINGHFEGIGAEIGIKNDRLTIVAPLVGSPAEKSGLLAGDVIAAIDGADAAYLSLNAAVSLIRGEGGTEVVLTVSRNEESPFDIVVTRGTIKIESVKYETRTEGPTRLGVITITHFNGDTSAAFKEVVQSVALDAVDGLVVDLRNNAGGFLDSSIEIASAFLPEGEVVVYEEDSAGVRTPYVALGGAQLLGIPVAILVNGGSASAAEILAGALEDQGVGRVIGTTTFGKGTVQDVQSLEDGSSLKLTVAHWLTPDEHQINEIGIEPEVTVERTNEDYSEDRDPQLDAAILLLSDPAAFDEKFLSTTDQVVEEGLE